MASMTASNEMPILRRDGDLFFNHLRAETILMVQVTQECLADVFGSDGSAHQDLKALRDNLEAILKVVDAKSLRIKTSRIAVTGDDF